jgi:hypothetical protein
MEIKFVFSLVLFLFGFHIGLREAEKGLTLKEIKIFVKKLFRKDKNKGPKQP